MLLQRRYRKASHEDLLQEGMLVFYQAAAEHDPGRGTPLLAFALQRAGWRMVDLCRAEHRHEKHFVSAEDLEVALGLVSPEGGAAPQHTLRSQKIARATESLQAITLASWTRAVARSPEERVTSPAKAELFERVGEALEAAAERDRELLGPLLLQGLSIRELTEVRGQARAKVTKQAIQLASGNRFLAWSLLGRAPEK